MPNPHLRRIPGRSNLRAPPTPTTPSPTPSNTPSLRRIPADPNLRSTCTLVPAPLRIHKIDPTSTDAAARAAAARAAVLREATIKMIEEAMIRGRTQAAILEAAEEAGVEWWVPDVWF